MVTIFGNINKMVSNIHVDSRRGRLLTIDEVEQVQRQSIAGLIGHIFQLTYANMVEELIQEEKLNRCTSRLCYSAPKSKTTFVCYDG